MELFGPGRDGADARVGTQFWKSFFEASANTKLSDPYTGDESITSENPLDVHGGANESLSFAQEDGASNASGSEDGNTPRPPPRGEHKWSDDLSPFQALQKDLDGLANSSANSSVTQAIKDVQRLRLGDLPPDSPDLPLPTFESSLDIYSKEPSSDAKGKARAYDVLATGSPLPRTLKAGADKHHPALLQKLLRKNLASPAPASAAASRAKQMFPTDVPKDWDGLANLSTTPLSSFASPTKWDDALIAPPDLLSSPLPIPQMSFALPASNYSQTPSKEAARRVARDVYTHATSPIGLESPLIEPPSVLKEWATRGYDIHPDVGPAPSPSEGKRKGFEEEQEMFNEADLEEDSCELPRVQGSFLAAAGGLADYGGGTTARIEDLLNEDSFARLVDDDEGGFGRPLEDEGEEELSYAEEGHSYVDEGQYVEEGHEEGHSYVEEGISQDGRGGLDGPEDTLFGMPQKKATSFIAGEEDDSFDFEVGKGQGSGFRMMGANEMDTLHGGILLESEPFEVRFAFVRPLQAS